MEKRKILLVDDVSLFIQLEKSFLSRDLFEISTARSGKEALRSIKAAIPDLVLLDLYMPDMNGDAVCREIKSDPLTKDVPIVIVSSEGDAQMERKCRLFGCDGFIHKPIRRDLLLGEVEKQLGIKQRRHFRLNTNTACTVHRGNDTHDGTIRNLSHSGACIETAFAPDLGELMVVIFTLPTANKAMEVKTSAKWIRKHEDDRAFQIGAEFFKLDPKEAESIKRYIE